MGRDHSIECDVCGIWYGGLNDTPCACNTQGRRRLMALWRLHERLVCLAANLATAAGLCAAFYEGFSAGFTSSGEGFNGEYAPRLTGSDFVEDLWSPNKY